MAAVTTAMARVASTSAALGGCNSRRPAMEERCGWWPAPPRLSTRCALCGRSGLNILVENPARSRSESWWTGEDITKFGLLATGQWNKRADRYRRGARPSATRAASRSRAPGRQPRSAFDARNWCARADAGYNGCGDRGHSGGRGGEMGADDSSRKQLTVLEAKPRGARVLTRRRHEHSNTHRRVSPRTAFTVLPAPTCWAAGARGPPRPGGSGHRHGAGPRHHHGQLFARPKCSGGGLD